MPILSLSRMLQPAAAVEVMRAADTGSWDRIMRLLRADTSGFIVLDARGDLSERLRAIGSALAVAEGIDRSLVVIWRSDADCSCRLRQLLAPPLSFALLELAEADVPESMSSPPEDVFQVYDYVAQDLAEGRPAGGSTMHPVKAKRARVTTTPRRVVFFRSRGDLMNHPYGGWPEAGKQLHKLSLAEDALQEDGLAAAPTAVTSAVTTATASAVSSTIGIHLCPHHVPRGPPQSLEINPERVQLLVVRDGGAATSAASASSTAMPPRFPRTSTLPQATRSCADARAMVRFLRSSGVILFASPNEDAATDKQQSCGTAALAASGRCVRALLLLRLRVPPSSSASLSAAHRTHPRVAESAIIHSHR